MIHPSKLPFLRIDNHCIAVNCVNAIHYIPFGFICKVGDNVYYDEDFAESAADKRELEVENHTVAIIVVDYTNADGGKDFVRRYGYEATNLWNYVTDNLASP